MMKNKYQEKINELFGEIRQLEQEKSEALRTAKGDSGKNKVEETYKKKLASLEGQLKGMQEKDRKQANLAKTSQQYTTKISSLNGEIDRMKAQKVAMMRKMKEE